MSGAGYLFIVSGLAAAAGILYRYIPHRSAYYDQPRYLAGLALIAVAFAGWPPVALWASGQNPGEADFLLFMSVVVFMACIAQGSRLIRSSAREPAVSSISCSICSNEMAE
jgi:hypothetical protein